MLFAVAFSIDSFWVYSLYHNQCAKPTSINWVYITKRSWSWSWSWDAKSWSWSWSWKKFKILVLVLKLKS